MLTALFTVWTLLILTTGFSVYDRLNFDITGHGARRSSAHLLHCLWLGLLMCATGAAVLYSLALVGQYVAPDTLSPLRSTLNDYISAHGLASVFRPLAPLHAVGLSMTLVVSFLMAPWMGAWLQRRRLSN